MRLTVCASVLCLAACQAPRDVPPAPGDVPLVLIAVQLPDGGGSVGHGVPFASGVLTAGHLGRKVAANPENACVYSPDGLQTRPAATIVLPDSPAVDWCYIPLEAPLPRRPKPNLGPMPEGTYWAVTFEYSEPAPPAQPDSEFDLDRIVVTKLSTRPPSKPARAAPAADTNPASRPAAGADPTSQPATSATRPVRRIARHRGAVHLYQSANWIRAGCSGAPVVNERMEFVGIVTGVDPNDPKRVCVLPLDRFWPELQARLKEDTKAPSVESMPVH